MLLMNDKAIAGVAVLHGEELSLTRAFVRLPDDTADLETAILEQVERDAAH